MGCGESKHDVATGNTITRKKSDTSSRKSIAMEPAKETSMEDNKTNPITLVQQEENQDVSNSGGGDDDINVEAASVSVADEDDDVKNKDIILDENKELKVLGGTEMEKGDGVEEQEGGRLISKESPNHFFSSRKDHEDIEGLAHEGRSENSEYCSPRIESSGNSKQNPFNETAKLDDDQQETLVDQARKPEIENEEAVIATEENMAKEAEPATTVEPEVPSPTVKKDRNAEQEEKLGTSPTEDPKAA